MPFADPARAREAKRASARKRRAMERGEPLPGAEVVRVVGEVVPEPVESGRPLTAEEVVALVARELRQPSATFDPYRARAVAQLAAVALRGLDLMDGQPATTARRLDALRRVLEEREDDA